MDTKFTYIYFLHNGNNIPFYIGKSINKNLHRSYQHKKTYGKNTILEIVDIVETKNWKFWESYWIEQFKQWGFDLKNKNNGGGGPLKYSEHSKQLKSKSMKKVWDEDKFNRNWSKSILHIPTGKIYPTIKSAKIDLSISWPKIYSYLKTQEIFKYV
jgi:hypothetical protein